MKKDITTKDLLSNNDVFADIANVNLFGGEQMILPEDLVAVPLETSYKDMDGKYHRLFRDIFMKVDKLGGCIAFLGFENQVDINRAMPVRDMGYTYTGYAKQIKDIVARNNKYKNSAYTKVLHEEQKLMPIATFVLYFGEEEWNEPLSLMDILDIPEPEKEFWKGFMNDYRIRVIHMVGQSEGIRSKYRSDYGVIADYLAYYNDRKALEGYLKNEKRKLIHVEQVLDMLEAFSNDKRFHIINEQYIESNDKEERDNMCLLLDMCEERGMERGIQQGMEQGIQQGMEQGMEHKAKSIAKNLLNVLEITTIAEVTGLSVEEVEQLAYE